ncbi:unnamed protein product, partial [Oikopleura dioica]
EFTEASPVMITVTMSVPRRIVAADFNRKNPSVVVIPSELSGPAVFAYVSVLAVY